MPPSRPSRSISSRSPLRQPSASPQATMTTDASSTLAWLKLAAEAALLLLGTNHDKAPGLHVVAAGGLQPGFENPLQVFIRQSGTIKAGRRASLRNHLRKSFLHHICHLD